MSLTYLRPSKHHTVGIQAVDCYGLPQLSLPCLSLQSCKLSWLAQQHWHPSDHVSGCACRA